MDFFEAQDAARRRTSLLIVYFFGAVLAIILFVYLIIDIAFMVDGIVNPVLLAVVCVGVGSLITIGSVSRTASLRQGGRAVARLLGGRRVLPGSVELDEQRLLNVVEEMSIASGLPIPAVYILDEEDGINAFAAGYAPSDAAVAVTRGALRSLTRDELQGVIAHEFSHIINGDMRLNIRLIGLLYGILLLSVIGRGILRMTLETGHGYRSRGRDRDKGATQVLVLGLGLIAAGYVGVLCGRAIKASISRQRELLADAAAVEFTRSPDGLAGALRKIRTQMYGSRIRNHHAEELSHMFFADGLGLAFSELLSTHPPIDERIRRLDPSLAGDGAEVLAPGGLEARGESLTGNQVRDASVSPPANPSGPAAGAPGRIFSFGFGVDQPEADETTVKGVWSFGVSQAPGPSPHPVAALVTMADGMQLIETIGSPEGRHLEQAERNLSRIPEEVKQAAHEQIGAIALVLGLGVVATEAEPGGGTDLGTAFGPQVEERVAALLPSLLTQPAELRVLLLDLALPALDTLSPDERERLLAEVQRMVESDGQLRLFEIMMLHILKRHLRGPDRLDRGGRRIDTFSGIRTEVEWLLSALAWTGAGWEPESARAAFAAGSRHLPSGRRNAVHLSGAEEVSLDAVAGALVKLQHASPELQETVLRSATACVSSDQRLETVEAQMLRTLSEALECPMPPVLSP